MGGDKIVLLDGAGANGGGAATNGLLSMIPGMFANLIGGNKMDPNLVAALMNGRNNQDGFGGANGWWLWIIVLFWLWGGRGFGNGFGNGGDCCANGLPAQLNNDYGRELLMQAIQGNRSAIDQIASALNCSTTQLQNAICNVQGAIDKVAGQVGMTSQAVINAVQQQGCEIGNQISSCCCNLSSLINQSTCQTQGMITQQGFNNQLRTLEQTNILQNGLNQGLANNREQATSQFNILSAKLDAQTVMINDKFCQLEMREMQNTIAQLREEKAALTASALSQQQTQNIVGQLRPTAVPAYPLGKVVAVSEPRYLPPQPGQYQAMQTRVVDLTVELTGETKTYTVPESQNVAKAMGITLSTSIDPIMNELNAIKSTSQEIIDSVDAHRAKIEACESILEDINPAFKQTREQDRKIAGIENKVNDLTDSFEDLKKLIVERLK